MNLLAHFRFQVSGFILCLTVFSAAAQPHTFNSVGLVSKPTTAAGPTYTNLLWDNFTTSADAPIGTPRVCEPGPGAWTVVQNDGTFGITNEDNLGLTNIYTGNRLKITGQASVTWEDLLLKSTNSFPTNCGLCYYVKFRLTNSATIKIGFERNTISGIPDAGGIGTASTLGLYFNANGADTALNIFTLRRNTEYELAVILRKKGLYIFMRSNNFVYENPTLKGFPDWTLIYVDTYYADQTVTPFIDVGNAGGYVDSARVMQLMTGVWTNQFGFATDYLETSSDNSTINSTFNCVVTHNITGATAVNQELAVRQIDATNKIIIRMDQTNSTAKIISMTNGVETELVSATKTWNNGQHYKLVVNCILDQIALFVDDGYCTKTAAAPIPTNSVVVTCQASKAGTNFASFPSVPRISIGDMAPARTILGFGDSKTSGSGDDTAPDGALAGYLRALTDGLNTNKVLKFTSMQATLGGAKIEWIATNTMLYCSRLTASPESILVNVGANDGATTNDAAFTNYYALLLDSLHTNFPSASVYVMGLWIHGGYSNAAVNIKNVGKSLVAARSSWCFNGPDESVFLENGDNGATYMYDDVHPNHAGYLKTAEQWRATLGL